MIDDHSAARQDVLTVANMLDLAPLPSDVQQMLKAKAEAQVADFHASNDDALDALYIDGQVADHAAVLTLLGDLTEAADAAELKNLIAMLELDVQAHYDEAVELKAALP
jgi:predicted outer membrane protein